MKLTNSYTQRFKTLEQRFWEKVDKKSHDECWLWSAAKDGHGYGVIKINGAMKKASRVAYELVNGPIPHHDSYHGYCVCHRCDTPACVNPSHLWIGLNSDNAKDMAEKSRSVSRPGASNPQAKLKETTVMRIRILKGCFSAQRIADMLGTPRSTVTNILYNSRWKSFKPTNGNTWGI